MSFVLSAEEELHWLALRLCPGLSSRKALSALERCGGILDLFRVSPEELEAAGLSPATARSLTSGCTFEDALRQQESARAQGVELIPYGHPEYPPQLKEIFDPPLLLYLQGRRELLSQVQIAVVGTRRPTAYGLAVAARLAEDLARLGLVIVSGMARGIDTAAHKSALACGGGTIAVFGCGIDVIYPAENAKLKEDIARQGLLVSEFPIGTPAYPQNFPIRNRIVSGLSAGVVVVEGAQYSGSAITARLALEQGKEVFAVPGNITSRNSWGPNLLIKQGAHLVQEASDVVDALPTEIRIRLSRARTATPPEHASQSSLPFSAPSGPSQAVLQAIPVDEPVHLDVLLEKVEDTTPSELVALLFELELSGAVRQLPGKFFVRVWNG